MSYSFLSYCIEIYEDFRYLDDEDENYSNIDFNGFTLYVNGSAIN